MTDSFGYRQYLSEGNRPLCIFLLSVLLVVSLAIFQDFLQSQRRGSLFFFSESLLFKSVWFFFPPILLFLKSALKGKQDLLLIHKGAAIAVATTVHILLVPPTIWGLSTLFRDQSYGLLKVLTFTLSHDLVVILLIYTSFVFLLKHSEPIGRNSKTDKQQSSPQYLVVNSGKDQSRVNLADILYVKSATPYVTIQVGEKQYLHSATLKSIGQKLGLRFVRIHKSVIVNIDKVVSCKSRLNGDYDLTLQDRSQIRLSRNYVSDFRSKFASGPQLEP